MFNFQQERRFYFWAAKLPCSRPLLCQKCTVADWQTELLIICYVLQMLHKWTVFYHYFLTLGPLGWQAKTQICLQPAHSGKKGKKKWPLRAESHSSLQSQFFRCSLFPVSCSSTQTSSGHNEKWCDVIFSSVLDALMQGNVVHWFQTPKRSRNEELNFLEAAQEKLWTWTMYTQEHKTTNCYSFCH